MNFVQKLTMLFVRLAMRRIRDRGERAEGGRKVTRMNKLGISCIGDVSLVLELTAPKYFVEAKGIECSTMLAWRWSGRRRYGR